MQDDEWSSASDLPDIELRAVNGDVMLMHARRVNDSMGSHGLVMHSRGLT